MLTLQEPLCSLINKILENINMRSNHLPNFDLETVKTFFAVTRSKNFTDAATLLHKTPAAVSYRIRALEEQFGVLLFERKPHSLEITEAGELLLDHFMKIQDLLSDLPSKMSLLTNGIESSYRIAISNLVLRRPLVEITKKLKEQFPLTDFYIETRHHRDLWEALIGGECDYAIGLPEQQGMDIDLQTIFWGICEWSLGSSSSITDTSKLPLAAIASERESPLHQAWIRDYGSKIFVSDVDMMIDLVRSRAAVAFIPKQLKETNPDLRFSSVKNGPGKTVFRLASTNAEKSPITSFITHLLLEKRQSFALTEE
ncbi:LysR family transcriptional regulator [Parasutterella secunda]|uniref:LysR family transcriptional regulator n=1 Tax=Parasutterella secunda TaxID=626947 RepID=UPI0025A4A011|nr:LysR family transcriptional regulator [Parasutterella secunda]